MAQETLSVVTAEVLDDSSPVTVAELCSACGVDATLIVEMVDYGILEPTGPEPTDWVFRAASLRRVFTVARLQRDLGVNLAGAALAVELLERIALLESRLARSDRAGP
jgi:chaperone modulatory protein CbpM